jgi:hypothetical protein
VDLGLVNRVDEQLEVRVGVHVDEAGTDDQSRRVDDASRPRVSEPPDRGHAPAGDADVGLVPRVPRAVDDTAASNQQVEQPLLLRVEIGEKLTRHPLVAREQAAVDGDDRSRDP